MRILFQPSNGIGLGHVSRLLAIAEALRQQSQECRILFAVEPGVQALLGSEKFPQVVIPAPKELLKECWGEWPEEDREGIYRGVAQGIIEGFRPDLVVFDTFPNRLVAYCVLEAAVPFVMCVRHVKEFRAYADLTHPMLTAARSIIVPHDTFQEDFPQALRTKSTVVGTIVRYSPPGPTASVIARDVLITSGGGGYPETVRFLNLAAHAFALAKERKPKVTGLLVPGPLFREWSQLEPATGLTIRPFEPDLLSAYRRTRVILCQAGYNTIAELATVDTAAVVIPAPRAYDNQTARAVELSTRQDNIRVYTGESPHELAELLLGLLERERRVPSNYEPPDGAARAATILRRASRDRGSGV